MKRKNGLLLVSLLMVFLLFWGCNNDNGNGNGNGDGDELLTVEQLYPLKENQRVEFLGDGNEFATFYTVIDYLEGNKVQRRTDNGGTQLVEVVQVADGEVVRLYQQGEVYYRENLLQKVGEEEILLKEPIEVGTQWELSDGRVRSITAVEVDVTTPVATYKSVEVTTNPSETNGDAGQGVTRDYYAKDVGLIKRVFAFEGDEITSTLEKVLENQPYVQSVVFYYPTQEYNVYSEVTKDVSFMTNQITRKTIEDSYKKEAPYPVLTPGSTINSLYLNQDGMVYIDVSKAFVTEMNAGAGYESMILQSLANTVGHYYGAQRVILTLDNELYESGHIAMAQGEFLEVK